MSDGSGSTQLCRAGRAVTSLCSSVDIGCQNSGKHHAEWNQLGVLLEPCLFGKGLSLLPGYEVSQKGHNTSEAAVERCGTLYLWARYEASAHNWESDSMLNMKSTQTPQGSAQVIECS